MCGIFGIYGHKDAAHLTYLGLYALQHRGQESVGIAASDAGRLYSHKWMGTVSEVFDESKLRTLKGDSAIGHVRYSTTGSSTITNAQPLHVNYSRGEIAIGHNGNLVNAGILRDELEAYGSIFQTTIDSEIIIHLMARSTHGKKEDTFINALRQVKGAYSLVFLTENKLVGARDPHGYRPLLLGKLGDAFVLSSETTSFDLIGAQYVRDIEPGEVVFIDKNGLRSVKPFDAVGRISQCIFEFIYFARPDSTIFGRNVYDVRKSLGRELAKEHPVEADLVTPVPDSGTVPALGYSNESGIPFEMGIIRNHYIGRTFLAPAQSIRDFAVKIKLNPISGILKGKRVVVVDDSIVRGTTSRSRINSLRAAGAKEIHMRISCPPHRHPCFYGIDFPEEKQLIAATHSLEEIRSFLGVDTLGYLSAEGMLRAVNGTANEFCMACFDGKYAVPAPKGMNKFIMEKERGI
ncbi:MAG TPA: amidophosphoribosyltransferase [bacterium]|nr:amidophosphoribosyltransferase [bacterium]